MTGTSDFGVKAFGAMGAQQAVPGSGNMIAIAKGGKRRTRKSRKTRGKGGAGLTEVAVPAALLIGNEIGKNMIRSRRFRSRTRRFRRR
jgi:hypothetical protein